jgi:hypothetical protein
VESAVEHVWGWIVAGVLGLAWWIFAEIVGEVLAWMLSPLTKPIERALSPPWRAYVRSLTPARVTLLWIGCLAGAGYALRVIDTTAGAAQFAAGAAIIALPTFAVVSTIASRGRRRLDYRPSRH